MELFLAFLEHLRALVPLGCGYDVSLVERVELLPQSFQWPEQYRVDVDVDEHVNIRQQVLKVTIVLTDIYLKNVLH